MKILYVCHQYWPFRAGAGTYFQSAAERLAARGHRVTVFTTDAFEFDYFTDPSKRRVAAASETHNGVGIRRFRVRHLPERWRESLQRRIPFRWAKHLFGIPFVPGLLAAAVRRGEFDIVHGGFLPHGVTLYAAGRIARRNRIPLVVTPCMHIGEPDDDRILRRYTDPHQLALLRDADLICAFTRVEKETLASFGVPAGRISVMRGGISIEELAGGSEDRFRRTHGVRGPVVLFLGTRGYDKGATHVVEAAGELWKAGRDFTLVLAGSASNRDFLAFFRSCRDDVKRRTLVLESVSDEEKRDLLDAAHLLAIPSRNESLGIAYLEAWACGKPVIGARAGAIREIIADGVDGFLVPFGRPAELAERIGRLLDDPALARAMGEAGRAKLLAEGFTVERMTEELETAYLKVCAGAAAR